MGVSFKNATHKLLTVLVLLLGYGTLMTHTLNRLYNIQLILAMLMIVILVELSIICLIHVTKSKTETGSSKKKKNKSRAFIMIISVLALTLTAILIIGKNNIQEIKEHNKNIDITMRNTDDNKSRELISRIQNDWLMKFIENSNRDVRSLIMQGSLNIVVSEDINITLQNILRQSENTEEFISKVTEDILDMESTYLSLGFNTTINKDKLNELKNLGVRLIDVNKNILNNSIDDVNDIFTELGELSNSLKTERETILHSKELKKLDSIIVLYTVFSFLLCVLFLEITSINHILQKGINRILDWSYNSFNKLDTKKEESNSIDMSDELKEK